MNKVIAIGNIGRIETKTFQDGKIVNASLAVNDKYTKRDGSRAEDVIWLNLVVVGKLADIFDRFVEKGDRLYIEGRLRERLYTTREGEEKRVTEVMVREVEMLGSRAAGRSEEEELPAPAEPASADEADLPF